MNFLCAESWNTAAIDSFHVEDSLVVNLAVLNNEGGLLALVAVVERVETAHNVPVSIDLIIIDALNIVRGGTARRIVQRVGSWKPEALVVSKHALHHAGPSYCGYEIVS